MDETAPVLTTTQHPRELCMHTIRQTHWGQGLEDDVLLLMLEYVQSYRVASGAVLCREGERGDFMAFVVSGRFRVHKGEETLAVLEAGSSFGEMALVDDEPRSASIVALEPSDILVLTALDFRQLLSDHAETAVRILFQVSRVLSQRVRFLNQRVLKGT